MRIYCDSSTREACYVIEEQEPVIIAYSKPVTNNVGEYQAVILALEWASKTPQIDWVEILTDSQLVVEQVNGAWNCNYKHLLLLRDKVRELVKELESKEASVQLIWIPRENNKAGSFLP